MAVWATVARKRIRLASPISLKPLPSMVEEQSTTVQTTIDLKPATRRAMPAVSDDQHSKISAKKKKSSDKERIRNLQIKKLLEEIRIHVPYVEKNLSKIRTLRLASEYINHLKRILNGDMVHCELTGSYRLLVPEDFKHVVMHEMQVTNSYKERAEFELSVKTSPQSQPKSQEFAGLSFHASPPINYPQFDPLKQPDYSHFSKDFNSDFYQFA